MWLDFILKINVEDIINSEKLDSVEYNLLDLRNDLIFDEFY